MAPNQYEAEVVPGIETIAMAELREVLGGGLCEARRKRPGFVRFAYGGLPARMSELRSIIAIYGVHAFAIPRPKAMLGHQHFRRLSQILHDARAEMRPHPRSFGIGAAGSESAVMRRLRAAIADALGLPQSEEGKGELFLRIARGEDAAGWEALVRTTPAPLSKRAYRRINMPGALNSTVAFAMTRAAAAVDGATVVNLGSGSATILIEHAMTRDAGRLLAIDNCEAMLAAGVRNAQAAGVERLIQAVLADISRAPLPPQSADLLYADLPFGNLVGTHAENVRLYPRVLREAARIARDGARFVVLTHEVQLLQRCLADSPWKVVSETRLNLRGLHPRLFVLRRNLNRIEGE